MIESYQKQIDLLTSEEQDPHFPCPPTWSPLLRVLVEHHGSVSLGAFPS